MTYINVRGGTNAGWRKQKPAETRAWVCGCLEERPAYLLNCLRCGERRGYGPVIDGNRRAEQ